MHDSAAYTRFHTEMLGSAAESLPAGSIPETVTQHIVKLWREMSQEQRKPYKTKKVTVVSERKRQRKEALPLSSPVRALQLPCT